MLLAVFEPPIALQKHDGQPLAGGLTPRAVLDTIAKPRCGS
jgi:hypothetical protein